MERMAKEIGRKVHDSASDSWNWHGREVFLVDGTGFSMPDTAENQIAYPQAIQARPGLGFPVMRAVGLFSLATGAVVDRLHSYTPILIVAGLLPLAGTAVLFLVGGQVAPAAPREDSESSNAGARASGGGAPRAIE
jgi:hypothetical protein